MGQTDRYGDGHSRIRVEKGVRKGERLIRLVEKTISSWHGVGLPGRLAQSGASLTANQRVAGSSPGPATYFRGDLS